MMYYDMASLKVQPMRLTKIKQSGKLSERVQSQLEQLILTGNLKVNDQLPTEAELSKTFGVSRTVIREAIHRLEAQGLVHARIGSGSYVAPFEMDQISSTVSRFSAMNRRKDVFLHLLDLRLVIETETVARVAENPSPEMIKQLLTTIKKMKDSRDDLVAFAEADFDFHLTLARSTNNPFFAVILEPLKSLGRDFGLKTYTNAKLLNQTCQDHTAIVTAIKSKDPTTARTAMLKHLHFSKQHYLALLEQS